MGVLPGLEASDLFSSLRILCAPRAPPHTPGLQDAAGRMEGTKPALRGPAAGQPACKSLHCPTFLADMSSPVRPSSEPKLPESQDSRKPYTLKQRAARTLGRRRTASALSPASDLQRSDSHLFSMPLILPTNAPQGSRLLSCAFGIGQPDSNYLSESSTLQHHEKWHAK